MICQQINPADCQGGAALADCNYALPWFLLITAFDGGDKMIGKVWMKTDVTGHNSLPSRLEDKDFEDFGPCPYDRGQSGGKGQEPSLIVEQFVTHSTGNPGRLK